MYRVLTLHSTPLDERGCTWYLPDWRPTVHPDPLNAEGEDMQRDAHLTNAALMARRQAAVARGVGQAHEIFVAQGRNAELWDVEGKRYIDFAGGIAVLNTGHCHPEITDAVKAQLERYTH